MLAWQLCSFTFEMISGVFLCVNETRVLTHTSFMSHCLSVCLSFSVYRPGQLPNCQSPGGLVDWMSFWLCVTVLLTELQHSTDCLKPRCRRWVCLCLSLWHIFQHTLLFLYLILSPCEKHITHKIHRHTFLFRVGLHRNPTWATYFFCFCSAKCDFCCEFRFRSWLTVTLPH